MNLGTELKRYLALGMDLQHRRIERPRYFSGSLKTAKNNWEEKVKWKQDRREGSLRSETVFPANWGTVYETNDRWEIEA